ncbi:hypothetical protein L596_020841 [Steinernema carpocapsae]|uniref:Dynein regulatory complex protein 10 n=1 Tax=Steinernema carpocapsae TaxID=34508 RepID=A0A4U5MVD4_STECR|nr:hypothetical protein L596_020841 [Steinernema carpocapsae]
MYSVQPKAVSQENQDIGYGLISPHFQYRLQAVRKVVQLIPAALIEDNSFAADILKTENVCEHGEVIINDVARFLVALCTGHASPTWVKSAAAYLNGINTVMKQSLEYEDRKDQEKQWEVSAQLMEAESRIHELEKKLVAKDDMLHQMKNQAMVFVDQVTDLEDMVKKMIAAEKIDADLREDNARLKKYQEKLFIKLNAQESQTEKLQNMVDFLTKEFKTTNERVLDIDYELAEAQSKLTIKSRVLENYKAEADKMTCKAMKYKMKNKQKKDELTAIKTAFKQHLRGSTPLQIKISENETQ